MARSPHIIHECPSVENTLSVAAYQAQYPAWYSLDNDKFVYHAGGPNYTLALVHGQNVVLDPTVALMVGPVALFVLDTSLVLWLDRCASGLDIPYTLISLHALQDTAHGAVLYLQLLTCDLWHFSAPDGRVQTVEITLSEHSPQEPMFGATHTILEVYDALGACSALHYDTDSASEDESAFGAAIPMQWLDSTDCAMDHAADTETPSEHTHMSNGLTSVEWVNDGVADDLDPGRADTDIEAGMNVAMHTTQIAGTVRRRRSSGSVNKTRKIG